ncbi:MFS transporter [Reichenbachiella agarivorans]|uniref:MFS transporter n=1 Tax=Reichenbachiella agarivorans TaxID=2979464 RepID=A0ABY6CRV4_9BACT|nr:MFS transporter [Reichenbachiella agarivorans]UXP32755.1 MFS transporter [Reichenbachiella agarivorans]
MTDVITKNRLFVASCMALTTTSMTFAIRAKLEGVFMSDYGLTSEEIGLAFGPAFWGFTLAMMIGGPLVDYFGMKKIINLAMLGHLSGIVLTLFAHDFWTLFTGTMLIGIGNGMVEAACNPLVATLFPDEKTKMLNRFHIWFPLGIVIGSVLGYVLVDMMGLSWMVLVGTLFIPLLGYVFLFFGKQLPQTERVSLGVSNVDMLKACVSPLFIFLVLCMMLTATTELGTGQRIDSLLSKSGVAPLLILAFVNGIMVVGRFFAGDIVKKLSITKMLMFSAIFSCIGLIWLSYASGMMTFAAAGVFAVGVCYFWPTMLSFVADKVPESGALGLSIMGGVGMFSVSVVLWLMGLFMDTNGSGADTLRIMAILPAILIVAFGALHFSKKAA